MELLLIGITVALCMIGAIVLFYDIAEHQTEYKINVVDGKRFSFLTKGVVVYSLIMIAITVGISALYAFYYQITDILTAIKWMALLAVLWPVGYIDFKTYRIPNTFILLGLLYRIVLLFFELLLGTNDLGTVLLSEIIAAGALLLAAVLCSITMKGSIGFGDMKLFIVMGILLSLDMIWSAILMTLIVSFIIAIVLLVTKRKSRKDSIPFGPAIAIGTYITICLTRM